MAWRPKNFRDSLFPILTFLAVIAFGVFDWPAGRPRVVLSVIYGIFITFMYWVLIVWTFKDSFESEWFDDEDKIIYLIVCINFAITLVTQLFHWIYYKKFERCLFRIIKVDETLHRLGESFNYTRGMKWAILMDVCWLVMVFLQNSIDVLWFIHKLTLRKAVMLVSVLHFPTHINTVVTLKYCLMMSQIGKRFRKANKLLEDTFKFNDKLSINNITRGLLNNKVNITAFMVSNNRIFQKNNKVTSLMQSVKHVHLELTLIAKDVVQIFSVIIILEMAAFFVLFTGLFWICYIMLMSPSPERKILRIIVVITLIIAYIPIVILINSVSERVTAEAKRTGSVIHCVYNGHEDTTFRDEIRQFTLQLLTNPLAVSPLGIFTLGYDFLRGYVGTVVTYLIIFIQLGSDPKILHQ